MKSILFFLVVSFSNCFLYAGEKATEPPIENDYDLPTSSDDQLKKLLDKLLQESDFRGNSLYEPCLNEIARRGGKKWEAILKAELDSLNKRQFKTTDDPEDTEMGSRYNLELLAVLRRIQKKSDPLVIEVENKSPLEGTPLLLPLLKVAIKNVDCAKATVGFRNGGNSRSGRQERWKVVVHDDKGEELPAKTLSGLIIGGGQYQEAELEYGESWETELNLNSFIKVTALSEKTDALRHHI